jgi:hypothetical protein
MTSEEKYVVIGANEHSLCYRFENDTFNLPGYYRVGILHGSVLRGGFNDLDGWTIVADTEPVRSATLADFEFFRVSPKGHIV